MPGKTSSMLLLNYLRNYLTTILIILHHKQKSNKQKINIYSLVYPFSKSYSNKKRNQGNKIER